MKFPPEIQAEYDRLIPLCRDDQDLVVDRPLDPNGVWKVYLRDAAPLVEFPSNFWEENTYVKHLIRTGKIDIQRAMTQPEGTIMSEQDFFDEFLID